MDMEWVHHPVLLLVNILAAFRLTRLVIDDAVPFGALRTRITEALDARTAWGSKPYAQLTPAEARAMRTFDGSHPLSYLLTCYWCAGLYTSALVAVLASTGTWWLWAAVPLALSAAVGLLANLSD